MNTPHTQTLELQLMPFICTSRPYYALQDLHLLTDTLMQCRITVENDQYSDAAPICPAEVGRHLAILGSCVLAQNNPVQAKHYYLAFEAYLERVATADQLPTRGGFSKREFVGRAQLESLNQRTGIVHTSLLTLDGELLYTLTVSYKVMKADVFEKLFRNHNCGAITPVAFNPYEKAISVHNHQLTPDGLTAEMGLIRPEQCVGHFDQYPALPIAILSSALLELAGQHLKQLCGRPSVRYATRYTEVRASRLAFAGEAVFLTSVLRHSNAHSFTFRVTAVNGDGAAIGFIENTFDLID